MLSHSLTVREIEIDRALTEIIDLVRRENEVVDRLCAARDRLPEWAKPGPCELYKDGSLRGLIRGWPQVEDMTPPDSDLGYRLVRPSLAETFSSHTVLMPRADDRRPWAVKNRRSTRLRGFAAVRKRISRVRQQRAEEASVGLPDLLADVDRISDRLYDARESLTALHPGCDPTSLAVMILLQMQGGARPDRAIEDQSFCFAMLEVLRRVRSALRGRLLDLVDDVVENADQTIGNLLIGGKPA